MSTDPGPEATFTAWYFKTLYLYIYNVLRSECFTDLQFGSIVAYEVVGQRNPTIFTLALGDGVPKNIGFGTPRRICG